MSVKRLRYNDGESVRINVGNDGEITLDKADGGLWIVYLTNGVGERNEIGVIFDDGWEYSDQSAKHPGFFALDEWADHVCPGNLIIDGRQTRLKGCKTLTQAARVIWDWQCKGCDRGLLVPWNYDEKKSLPEPLTESMKLARCLAFIRDQVMHNDEIGMSQRSKGASFLTEIGE